MSNCIHQGQAFCGSFDDYEGCHRCGRKTLLFRPGDRVTTPSGETGIVVSGVALGGSVIVVFGGEVSKTFHARDLKRVEL